MREHEGKLALVTGAAGSIGLAAARALAERGCRVVMMDLDAARLEPLAADIEGATPRTCDVGDPEAVAAACAAIRESLGPVEILVNNAGPLSNEKAGATTAEEWRRLMRVNLDGAFYLAHEWLPGMVECRWGRIVNMCSVAMKTGGLTAGTAYTASKGGLAALTFSLAREAAPHGVTANGIAPAYVRSPRVIAHVVCFLASPQSGFITGEIIDINGGLYLD